MDLAPLYLFVDFEQGFSYWVYYHFDNFFPADEWCE